MPIVNRGPCACCVAVTLVGIYPVEGPNCSNVPFTWTSPTAGYCTSSTNMVKMYALYSDNSTVVFEVYFPATVPSSVYNVVYFDDVPFTYDGKCYKWTQLGFLAPTGSPSYPYPHSAVLSDGAFRYSRLVEVACP